MNPLVDAAAYLFSAMGKFKESSSYNYPTKLRADLIREINKFEDNAKTHGYSSENLLISRYALCATLDDIIANTTWGSKGEWESQSLLSAYNHEPMSQVRFFLILERLIKDPKLYIDLMEFMYLCLSMGFKGHYRALDADHHQLEQIINGLYQRIRAFRGHFSKTLSPFPTSHLTKHSQSSHHMPGWLIICLSIGISLAVFAGFRFTLNLASVSVYNDLTRMERMSIYERDR